MTTLHLLFLTACSQDNELNERTDIDSPYDFPEIEVSRMRIGFGELGYGQGAEEVFTIDNVGDDTLIMGSIMLTVGGEAFSILETGLPREDDPDTEADESITLELEPSDPPIEIPVAYAAWMPGATTGEIVVESNDYDEGVVTVVLEGIGLMPLLEIYPSPIAADTTFVGCAETATATLRNVGNQPLDVTAVSSEGVAFSVVPPALPFTLDPGAFADVAVRFTPQASGESFGNLLVTSTDPRQATQTVPELGNGAFPGSHTQTHIVPLGGMVDVLVWADQSTSMEDDQLELANNYPAFVGGLQSLTDDWQMIVVTGNTGCNVSGGILTPDTPDLETTFAAAVQEGGDSWWSEAGLYVTDLALQQTTPFTCNAGFLREDALLHVIIITDEPDDSPELPSTYVRRFQALKGSASLVKVSAVAGDIPSGCKTPTNSAAPGTGYDEAVEMTYGAFVSLCSDWPSQISTVSGYGIVQTTFDMEAEPDESTIQVTVDGVARVDDHYYDRDAGALVFTYNPPFQGQIVVISYDAPLVCSE